jgi:predicted glycogen debranching enzyme
MRLRETSGVIAFGPDVCGDFDRGTTKEWIETNGLGGYASSTIVGANTRRYHALLVAALKPPTRRTVLLSKVEETLSVREIEYDLSCNQYPGAIHPEGYRYLREFRLDPFPTFVYEVGDGVRTRLEKAVAMCRGRNMVIIRYRVLGGPGMTTLIVRPLVNCRDHHHLLRENARFDTTTEVAGAGDCISLQAYPGLPPLHILFEGACFEPWGDWYRSFEYLAEAERGLDFREDLYSPGFFTCDFNQGETRYLVGTTDPPDDLDPGALMESEQRRRTLLLQGWEEAPAEITSLVGAAETFLVSRGLGRESRDSLGVIAGYHWFEEWGRDAMIALPGLTLATGRHADARKVLSAFASECSQGMIPNRIRDADQEPDYNTADATLWMFWAAHKYLEYTEDRPFIVDRLLPALVDAIEWHVRGTRYGIKMDGDGLLTAGEPGTQLTWMDAKVGDWVVTPRHGKAVEINALWHHALRFLEAMGAKHAAPSAEEVAQRFRDRFWNEQVGHLNDVVDGEATEDASLRPNQIFAVSLPYPLLEPAQAREVVAAVKRHLLTPYGLRTLSSEDPRYQRRYSGDQAARDGAYHQGTVWAWLLGPFITAYLRVADHPAAAREEARGWLRPLWTHLRDAGVGQISEIFDGDAPHHARGCIAQAWSVAEVLRAAVEDLGLRRPAR